MRVFPLLAGLCALCLPITSSWAWTWSVEKGPGEASAAADQVSLHLKVPGTVSATAADIPVKAGSQIALSFQYTSQGLSRGIPFEVVVRWYDAAGVDVDQERLALGFPPVVKTWTFSQNARESIAVSDNLSVPDRAVTARLTVSLSIPPDEKDIRGGASIKLTSIALSPGEKPITGIEMAKSGPDDAGPLSKQPSGHTFAPNLAPNPAFEEGSSVPEGWKIEGDNANGSAEWAQGGSFSGKRALKINDRGPFVKSWDRQSDDVFVPGSKPGTNYASAREEVSARWVSDPVPATPGTFYQSSAFYWYPTRANLDHRGIANPVRIQFLDAKGKVIPYKTLWDDWFRDARAYTREGWVFIPGKPVQAPANAVSLRTVIALNHAFYDQEGGSLRKSPAGQSFVLVDNLSVYALPEGAESVNSDRAYQDAVAAGAVPFVPTSAAHRPNTIDVSVHTELPGGLLMRSPAANSPLSLALQLTNYLGDARKGIVDYEIVDLSGKSVGKGSSPVQMLSFQRIDASVSLSPDLPFGPYLIRYALQLDGEKDKYAGVARFGITPSRDTSPTERSRMDYPFSLWMHTFAHAIGTPDEEILGRLAEAAGAGKSWFGCGGMIHPDHFMRIKDPAARREAMQQKIAEAKVSIAAWRKYGITPMGGFQPTDLLDPSDYPILAEIITTFVSALKDDIKFWRHGTESIHGGASELDRATMEEGKLSGQGGSNYLYWGRTGTVRQYWAEYEVAYRAAKQADPDCFFGPQSASDTAGNVLRLFFKVLGKQDLDMFGMNTYISAFAIWLPNVRQLQENGVPDLPLFVSEFDVGARTSPLGEDHLAREWAASRQTVKYWSSVLQTFPNFFHLEQWGMILGDDDGSLTYERLIRPQYLAYATMTNTLGAGRFVAKYTPPGVEMYVRERSVREGHVAVVWAAGEADAPLELEVGAGPVTIVDLWGNQRPATPENGAIVLTATKDPVYVVSSHAIKPAVGVRMVAAHATESAGNPRISVSLTNEKAEPLKGDLEVLPDGPLQITERKREGIELAAGETKTILFDVRPVGEAKDRRIPIRLRFKVDGKTYESQTGLNFHIARKQSATLDGKSGDWAPEELTLKVNRKDQFSPRGSTKDWAGPSDLSAQAGFRWDDQFLYALFIVRDDIDIPPADNGVTMWNRDLIELLVDTSRHLAQGSPFTMFSLGRYPDGPRVLRHDGPLPQGPVPGSRIAAFHEGDTTVYEAAIPWKEINPDFSPTTGHAISLAFGINDHDGGDTGRRQISWFSPASEKNSATFGDLILATP